MDYVEGEDLSAYLTRRGDAERKRNLKAILYPLLSALEVVHTAELSASRYQAGQYRPARFGWFASVAGFWCGASGDWC